MDRDLDVVGQEPAEDLLGFGMLGLIAAADSFEPERGLKFSTYAYPKIRGAILDSLRGLDWAPRQKRRKAKQIEAAIAFGGELPADDSARVIRFANRVPLLFQQSACSSFKAVSETGWRNYNLSQPRGSVPVGPLVILIHMASVWVPFTSESKEAIADYDEIRKEMKLALMECGRKLGTYLRKRQAMQRQAARRDGQSARRRVRPRRPPVGSLGRRRRQVLRSPPGAPRSPPRACSAYRGFPRRPS